MVQCRCTTGTRRQMIFCLGWVKTLIVTWAVLEVPSFNWVILTNSDDAGWEVHGSKNNFQNSVRRLRIIFLFQLDAVNWFGRFAALHALKFRDNHNHQLHPIAMVQSRQYIRHSGEPLRQTNPPAGCITRLCQVGPWGADTGLSSSGKRWRDLCWGLEFRCWL